MYHTWSYSSIGRVSSIGFLIWTFFLYFPKIHRQKIIRNQTIINAENFVKREGFCGGMHDHYDCVHKVRPQAHGKVTLVYLLLVGLVCTSVSLSTKTNFNFVLKGLSSSILRKCHTYVRTCYFSHGSLAICHLLIHRWTNTSNTSCN